MLSGTPIRGMETRIGLRGLLACPGTGMCRQLRRAASPGAPRARRLGSTLFATRSLPWQGRHDCLLDSPFGVYSALPPISGGVSYLCLSTTRRLRTGVGSLVTRSDLIPRARPDSLAHHARASGRFSNDTSATRPHAARLGLGTGSPSACHESPPAMAKPRRAATCANTQAARRAPRGGEEETGSSTHRPTAAGHTGVRHGGATTTTTCYDGGAFHATNGKRSPALRRLPDGWGWRDRLQSASPQVPCKEPGSSVVHWSPPLKRGPSSCQVIRLPAAPLLGLTPLPMTAGPSHQRPSGG
jgi:hypothetical protein